MKLIDIPFELLNPKDFDQVITELQKAKRVLVEALLKAADDIHDYSDPNEVVQLGSEVAKYQAIANKWSDL